MMPWTDGCVHPEALSPYPAGSATSSALRAPDFGSSKGATHRTRMGPVMPYRSSPREGTHLKFQCSKFQSHLFPKAPYGSLH